LNKLRDKIEFDKKQIGDLEECRKLTEIIIKDDIKNQEKIH